MHVQHQCLIRVRVVRMLQHEATAALASFSSCTQKQPCRPWAHHWGLNLAEVIFRWRQAAILLLVAALLEWPGHRAVGAKVIAQQPAGLAQVILDSAPADQGVEGASVQHSEQQAAP